LFLLAFKRRKLELFYTVVGVIHQPPMMFCPLMPAGASPFPVAEKDQNATAASDAMKGSGLANGVRAAPAKAEERRTEVQ